MEFKRQARKKLVALSKSGGSDGGLANMYLFIPSDLSLFREKEWPENIYRINGINNLWFSKNIFIGCGYTKDLIESSFLEKLVYPRCEITKYFLIMHDIKYIPYSLILQCDMLTPQQARNKLQDIVDKQECNAKEAEILLNNHPTMSWRRGDNWPSNVYRGNTKYDILKSLWFSDVDDKITCLGFQSQFRDCVDDCVDETFLSQLLDPQDNELYDYYLIIHEIPFTPYNLQL
jgi:hypothetical protein